MGGDKNLAVFVIVFNYDSTCFVFLFVLYERTIFTLYRVEFAQKA